MCGRGSSQMTRWLVAFEREIWSQAGSGWPELLGIPTAVPINSDVRENKTSGSGVGAVHVLHLSVSCICSNKARG